MTGAPTPQRLEIERMDAIVAAYNTWPVDIRAKLSLHDLRRMTGWTPARQQPAQFQAGVTAWMGECFLPEIIHDRTERGDRLLEEVLELLQSHGYDRGRVATLVEYVYGRPVGEPAQEVGGVMVTLAAYCMVAGLDMHAEGARELGRITQPEVMAKIRRKQEAKRALHFDTPLPGSHADLTKRQLHVLRHSLGVGDDGKGVAYRNHFVTGEGSKDHPDCMALVALGLMTRRDGSPMTGGDDLFTVTDAGKAVAVSALEQEPQG